MMAGYQCLQPFCTLPDNQDKTPDRLHHLPQYSHPATHREHRNNQISVHCYKMHFLMDCKNNSSDPLRNKPNIPSTVISGDAQSKASCSNSCNGDTLNTPTV
ncbi:Uncharacterised protein [Escherichia coli]|nr:Uncharacterised protein [Escherichia coli]